MRRAAAGWVDLSPVLGWQPRSIVVVLLAASLEVAVGRRWLAAPDGYGVRHLVRDRGPGAGWAVLQVWRVGDLVGEVAGVAALAWLFGAQDLELLVEEPVEVAGLLFEADQLG